MTQIRLIIICILTITGCTHPRVDFSTDQQLKNVTTNLTLTGDSIDRYGLSGCVKSFDSLVQNWCLKAIDSAWKQLLRDNKNHQQGSHYSKDKFKNALIDDGFNVDTSGKWTIATKKRFNERWRAEWVSDSNYIQLIVTRWYHGYTYDYVIGIDKFDK